MAIFEKGARGAPRGDQNWTPKEEKGLKNEKGIPPYYKQFQGRDLTAMWKLNIKVKFLRKIMI